MSGSCTTDIVIIGAGVAGLQAAKTLQGAGRDFIILEASHRIGGRAYTEQVKPGEYFDLGAHWMHAAGTNPFLPVSKQLGYESIAEEQPDLIYENGRFLGDNERQAYNGYGDEQFDRMEKAGDGGRDLSVLDATDQESRWAPYFNFFMSLDNSTDVDRISTQAYLTYDEVVEERPLIKGFGNLIAAWGADMDVRLNSPVTEIDWSGRTLLVKTPRGTISANRIILTVSTGILAAGDIKFSPHLPDWKMEAVRGLPIGNHNRICLAFDRDPFGPDAPDEMFLAQLGADEPIGCHVKPYGYHYVELVNGGRFADWLEQAGQQATVDYYKSCLQKIFGSDITKTINREIVTAWRGDPWTKGAYSTALPGQNHQREAMARDIDGRIFFAGEACSKHSSASVQGAFWSGEATAGAIVDNAHN